jgi:hypothetical protein
MLREDLEKIFENDDIFSSSEEGEIKGLVILSKYCSNPLQGADHDIIYSEDVDKLIEHGITEEDCIKLRKMGWMIYEDDYLARFV